MHTRVEHWLRLGYAGGYDWDTHAATIGLRSGYSYRIRIGYACGYDWDTLKDELNVTHKSVCQILGTKRIVLPQHNVVVAFIIGVWSHLHVGLLVVNIP
jgi:hypothetical protein